MKYVLLTHRRYRAASVLETTVEYASAPEVIALTGATGEVAADISAGVVGHHFVDTPEFTYQVVVKAP